MIKIFLKNELRINIVFFLVCNPPNYTRGIVW